MTNSRQTAIEAVKGFKAGLQTRLDSWPAYTGDGRGNLRNSDSDSQYMLVRWPLATSPAVEVLNESIPDVENLRVMVGYTADQPDVLRILSRADSRADNTNFVGVMNHSQQHGYLAADMDWIDFRRVLSFRVIPYSGLNVYIYGGVLPVGGTFVNVANQVVDMTASVPVSGARYSAISVATDGTITVTDGSTQPTAQALTIANVPAVPSGEFRLAAVLLRAGQTSITETLAQNDLLDLRWPQAHLESTISPSSIALANTHVIVGNASGVGADVAMSGDATIANTGAVTLATVNSNVGSFTNASITVNAKGLITAASSGTAPVTGSGTPGRVSQWATSSTLGDSNLIGSGAGVLTLSAAGTYTLTVPATGTAALLQVANTFTLGPQTVQTGADANKGIISKANSATQTGNLIEVQSSGGTGLSAFGSQGNVRIGSAVVRDAIGLQISKTYTSTAQDAVTAYYYGSIIAANASPTGNTVSDWRLYGIDLTAQANNANNINGQIYAAQFAGQINMTGGTLTSLYGGLFANTGINASGTATTTNTFAGRFQLGKSGAGTWTIGTASLISIGKPSVSDGTLSGTTLYALNIEDMNGANSGTWTNRYAVNSAGGRWVLANTADEVLLSLTGFATQSTTTALQTLTRNDANTNAVGTVLTLAHNSTGTAAAGFGGALALNLESSTTADQSAAAFKWLWTDATHATRTSRADIETTGPGHCAAWGYNGVNDTARYIINNGTGDVTEGVTVQYVASEVTGTDSYGGVVYLEPSDSFAICTDGTNTLVMTCAADGSLYVQRSAGTDTFKFSCWAVWQ